MFREHKLEEVMQEKLPVQKYCVFTSGVRIICDAEKIITVHHKRLFGISCDVYYLRNIFEQDRHFCK